VLLVFSIFLTSNVTTFLYSTLETIDGDKGAERLRKGFGSLPRAVYTLFVSVTGGVSWQEISDLLFEIDWLNGVLFCFYIFFTVFGMLNIITGIFLDASMQAAQNDENEVITEQLHAADSTIKELRKLFIGMSDADEQVSYETFCNELSNPRLRAHLSALGIEPAEAEGLFKLLDLDNSGTVSVEEFLYGCMRMKGHAKALDMQTLLYENKRMLDMLDQQFQSQNRFAERTEADLRNLQLMTLQIGSRSGDPSPTNGDSSAMKSDQLTTIVDFDYYVSPPA
jgi:Ca2+-binding EF-hand superfamily protein